MEPSNQARFCNSFYSVVHDIAKGLSASQTAATNEKCTKWAEFCQDLDLNPLLILHRDPVHILNTFARHYWTLSLAPSIRHILSHTVGDYIRSIVQVLAAMGAPYPCLKSQGEIDIRLRFKYWCYSKNDPPTNRVKPTPLQVLRHISSIAMASGDPLLMAESDMITISHLFPPPPC